jgi:hypothetical protein
MFDPYGSNTFPLLDREFRLWLTILFPFGEYRGL